MRSMPNKSHTEKIATIPESSLSLTKWGPFENAMSSDLRYHMEREGAKVAVVAGGSALGYLIDAIMVASEVACGPCFLLFSPQTI